MTRCDIDGCHRERVLTFSHNSPPDKLETEAVDMCLPCYRARELGNRTAHGDFSTTWHSREAFEEFRPD